MSKCPECGGPLAPFALRCEGCGHAQEAMTLIEGAVPSLRSDLGLMPTPPATRLGSPTPPRALEHLATVRDGHYHYDPVSGQPVPSAPPIASAAPPTALAGPPAMATKPPVVRADLPIVKQPLGDAETPAITSRSSDTRRGMLSPGEIVAGYLVDAEIGRGGMGRVYRAVHEVTGQVVALKMLLPKLMVDKRLKARFVNEAKTLARLQHPNLVRLLSFIDTGHRALIVMPFIDAVTLEHMLARDGRMDIPDAVDIFRQLCAGVGYAHGQAVMHRDLKPSNILVQADGKALITDFGIARVLGSQKMTLTGMVVGTAEYLSPEQASGTVRDDVRSDIYALGVLLYEMLTGRVPFSHANAAQVLLKHVSSPPPPPRTIRPEIPISLEDTLLCALAKAPSDRFVSVDAFCEAVVAAADEDEADTVVARADPMKAAITGGRSAEQVTAPSPIAKPAAPTHLLIQVLVGATIGAALAAGAWYILNP